MKNSTTIQPADVSYSFWSSEFPMGGSALQIAVAQNVTGALQIFYIGTGNHLYYNVQNAANSLLWSGETPFIGIQASAVVAARNADGRLEIFYIGVGGHLYHNWQVFAGEQTWAGETPFPNASASAIAVGLNTSDGTLELFYAGTTNGTLYRNRQTSKSSSTEWSGPIGFDNDAARQIAVGQNFNGRLEIFYVGINGNLYHNRQTTPGSTTWSGETPFSGDSAKQVDVALNQDGTLEIFYVGSSTKNQLYRNRQTTADGTVWGGETPFDGDYAKEVTVGQNSDGRLEIFYVGINNTLYHNYQTDTVADIWAGESSFPADIETNPASSAQQVVVATNANSGPLEIFYVGTNNDIYHRFQTTAPELGSNANYFLSGSNCQSLNGVSVTIDITEDIVAAFSSGPTTGFGFQLNGYSPLNYACAWQQYVISLYGNELMGFVNNWPISGNAFFFVPFNLVALPSARLPAGYQLKISLGYDSLGNVYSATFVVIDNGGNTLANVTKVLTSIGATSAELAPITAFTVNVVGPINKESSILSSGAGTITYSSATSLTPMISLPLCTETKVVTEERANTIYGMLPSNTFGTTLTQSFNVQLTDLAPGEPV